MATTAIVLCADDYGIAPGVGRAIRDLLDRHHLSATSCMVVSPDFGAEGPLLAPYAERADVGLHLTLTQDQPLGRLMLAAYSRKLDSRAIAAEVERQIARFTQVVGRAPDFIDGHQHVHLLPGVREAVAASAKRIGAYLRLTDEPLLSIAAARGRAGQGCFSFPDIPPSGSPGKATGHRPEQWLSRRAQLCRAWAVSRALPSHDCASACRQPRHVPSRPRRSGPALARSRDRQPRGRIPLSGRRGIQRRSRLSGLSPRPPERGSGLDLVRGSREASRSAADRRAASDSRRAAPA